MSGVKCFGLGEAQVLTFYVLAISGLRTRFPSNFLPEIPLISSLIAYKLRSLALRHLIYCVLRGLSTKRQERREW